MKKLFLSLSLVIIALSANARGYWNLQGVTYAVDTLFHAKVGPGTTQTSLNVVSVGTDVPLRVFYTTTDLTNEYVDIKHVKAKDILTGTATVPSMATSKSKPGEVYFAGVNADFFHMSGMNLETPLGYPLATTVVDKEVYYAVPWRTQMAIDDNKKIYLADMKFSGSVKKANGTTFGINTVNYLRNNENMTIYTSRKGSNTGTVAGGLEYVIVPSDGEVLAFGKPIKFKISGAGSTSGSMAIPAGGYVISGHGNAANFLTGLADGDEIEITLSLKMPNGTEVPVRDVASGCPMILENSVVLDNDGSLEVDANGNPTRSRQPRTAVGYDATGTKLVLLVVDGRSDISVGVYPKVLADIMRETGCVTAMNFDGGASSTLYVKEFGVRNVPSGGALRAVSNGVYTVAVCPEDSEIAEIRFKDLNKTLPKYGYYTPSGFYGYNKYGVLVNTDVKGVKLSCPAGLGTIVNDGTTLNANGEGSHLLTATYNGITTNLVVDVKNTTPYLKVESVTFDEIGEYKMEPLANVGEDVIVLNNSAFTWTSSDTSVATVDAEGIVKALKEGTAIIKGVVENHTLELTVNIEVPTSRHRNVDLGKENAWTTEGENVSNPSIETVAAGGFNLKFTPTATKQVSFDILNELTSWSRPDSICVEVNPGNAKPRYMYILGIDQSNPTVPVEYKLNVNGKVLQNTNNKIAIAMSDIVNTNYVGSFPFTLTGIRFSFLSIDKVDQSFYIPKVYWLYDKVASGIESVNAGDNTLTLCPNPVTAGTAVSLGVSEAVNYTVNALNGAQVAAGNGTEVATDGLAAGIYVVSAKVGNVTKTAKLIVK